MKSIFFCKYFVVLIVLSSFIAGCYKKQEPEEVKGKEQKKIVDKKNVVETIALRKGIFEEELLFNGKLIAVQKSKLKFEISGSLESLSVENGQYVYRNSILASLSSFAERHALESAQINLKKTKLEFEDMLVSRGYDLNQKDSIPDAIFEMASIRSGYAEAQKLIDNSKHKLTSTILKAPFSGKVSGIKYKEYEQVNAGSEFLTLINDSTFEVEFYLLESEINRVKKSDYVEVLAFNDDKIYKGKITSINPIVEKNGTVLAKAKLENDGSLLEGMNVKIKIKKAIEDQFVVPKEAIVLRQNQEVLFKYLNGKTSWIYVNTIYENSESFAIRADNQKSSANLKEHDTIIVSGNLNLGHDVKVEVLKHTN